MNPFKFLLISILTPISLFTSSAFSVEYEYSGYLSITAGKVVDGDKPFTWMGDALEFDCPCYIADFTDVGVYEDNGVDFSPDSGYGLNGRIEFSDLFSIAAQLEGKGGNDFEPTVSWLFMRFDVTNHLSIDIGRKALPLYFYSDFINVSYAYPMLRVTGDIYGWPLPSYNGISASYINDWGEGSYTISAWYGEEEDDDNRAYNDIYWGAEHYYLKWSDMFGAAFEYDHGWITVRAVVMTNKDQEEVDWGGDWGVEIVADDVTQDFYGFAVMIDYENVLIQSEYNKFDTDNFESEGYFMALGYRYHSLTPMISYSKYRDYDPLYGRETHDTVSYSLRWDFHKSAALTTQYDIFTDDTSWYSEEGEPNMAFTGDSKVFAVGVDYVF